MSERWPFCFDADDVEVTDVERGLARETGVMLTHVPTGSRIYFSAYSDRTQNIEAGMRRLDRLVRNKLSGSPW